MNSARAGDYLPSLDGLRAIAVTVVLLFHLKLNGFQGGFIGVDVFFVISGFIITKGITSSLERGEFSYSNFLARRFFRLAPALVAVLLVSSAIAYLTLSPGQLVDYGKSALAATFSVSNIYFYLNSGYFDGDSWSKPLLHTWSLGVEEQFYLIWPLLLVAAFKIGERRGALYVVGAVSILSLITTHLWFKQDPSATFYLTPFRVFQLGIGSSIAVAGFAFTGMAATVAAAIGFAGIVYATTTVTGSGNYAAEALLPAVAAGLFIAGMKSATIERVFGHKLMSAIGRRSYSIYLVHWPLVVLVMPILPVPQWLAVVTMIAASLALGEILHQFVEKPFRKVTFKRRIAWGAPVVQLAVVAVCVSFWATSGFSARYSDNLMEIVRQSKAERGEVASVIEYGKCAMSDETPMEGFDVDRCLTPSPDKPTVAVLGDSFGSDSVLGLRDVFGEKYHIAVANLSGCMPLPMDTNIPRRPACVEFNKKRFDFVKAHHYEAIILVGNWWASSVAKEIARSVAELKPYGTKIYVMGVRVSFDKNVSDILVSAGNIPNANAVLRSHATEKRYENNNQFRDIITTSGGVYLDVLNSQCRERSCNAVTGDGKLAYFDNAHLTRAGAVLLARSVESATGGAL